MGTILRTAAAVESGSNHPLALAVVRADDDAFHDRLTAAESPAPEFASMRWAAA